VVANAATLDLSQDNEIDVVLKLLEDLKNKSKEELEQLEHDWELTHGRKQSAIEAFTSSVQV
jgi:ABC-type lipopolysaccharide export system ATPase subunit